MLPRNCIETFAEFLQSQQIPLSPGGFLIQLDPKDIKQIRQTVHSSIVEINNMWAISKNI